MSLEILPILILSILILIVLGLVIGLISRVIMPRYLGSTIKSILLGIGGSVIGGLLAIVFFGVHTRLIDGFLFAIIGAIIVLVLYGIIAKQNVPTTPNKNDTQQLPINNPQTSAQHEFQVKICPTCKRTYPDISLRFCLDDGILLSNTVTVQSQRDPEETIFFPRVS